MSIGVNWITCLSKRVRNSELLSFIWRKHLFIVAKKATKESKDSFVLMKKGHVGPNPMNGKFSRGGFDITLLKKPSKWRLCSGQLDNHVHLFIPQFFHCLAVETISFRFIFFQASSSSWTSVSFQSKLGCGDNFALFCVSCFNTRTN